MALHLGIEFQRGATPRGHEGCILLFANMAIEEKHLNKPKDSKKDSKCVFGVDKTIKLDLEVYLEAFVFEYLHK